MITINIDSDENGEGKTSIAGIVVNALEKCGYKITITPIPAYGHPDSAKWIKLELDNVTRHKVLLNEPEKSYPKSNVNIEVNG